MDRVFPIWYDTENRDIEKLARRLYKNELEKIEEKKDGKDGDGIEKAA